jgi:Fe-S-cluster containining protein
VLDCTRCGACCANPAENEAEGFRSWVEVEAGASLWRRRDLVKRLVVLDDDGAPHLKLDSDGRCAALRGALGKSVRCSIYAHRPHACRRVQAGDRDCLRYRAALGIA